MKQLWSRVSSKEGRHSVNDVAEGLLAVPPLYFLDKTPDWVSFIVLLHEESVERSAHLPELIRDRATRLWPRLYMHLFYSPHSLPPVSRTPTRPFFLLGLRTGMSLNFNPDAPAFVPPGAGGTGRGGGGEGGGGAGGRRPEDMRGSPREHSQDSEINREMAELDEFFEDEWRGEHPYGASAVAFFAEARFSARTLTAFT